MRGERECQQKVRGDGWLSRYPANVPEKKLKKKLKELLWGSRLSSHKIDSSEEDVKPCIIQLTHRASKRL